MTPLVERHQCNSLLYASRYSWRCCAWAHRGRPSNRRRGCPLICHWTLVSESGKRRQPRKALTSTQSRSPAQKKHFTRSKVASSGNDKRSTNLLQYSQNRDQTTNHVLRAFGNFDNFHLVGNYKAATLPPPWASSEVHRQAHKLLQYIAHSDATSNSCGKQQKRQCQTTKALCLQCHLVRSQRTADAQVVNSAERRPASETSQHVQ